MCDVDAIHVEQEMDASTLSSSKFKSLSCYAAANNNTSWALHQKISCLLFVARSMHKCINHQHERNITCNVNFFEGGIQCCLQLKEEAKEKR